MTDKAHDCVEQGHVWLEPDGTLYTRHRDREANSTIDVACVYCPATATLGAHGNNTSPPQGDDAKKALVVLMQDPDVAERVATIRTTGPSFVP